MRSSLAAAALSCAIVALSIGWQSTALGGADQYSYVTAAGLIGRGRLIVHQTIPQYTPWPGSDGTWTPIGYIEVPGALGAITPVVPPGLPLLMAVLQRLFGFCGAFWVVPMCAGLTVWCTFRLAMRLFARHDLALASAALIAVSPAFLAHCISPLSDVPATAGWLLAVLLLVDDRPIAAGISAAIAIAVRPNLVPIAVALLGWAALLAPKGTIPPEGLAKLEGLLKTALASETIKTRFAALSEAYHGDTVGSVSVGGMALFHGVFRGLLFDVERLPTPRTVGRWLREFRAHHLPWVQELNARGYETLDLTDNEMAKLHVRHLVGGHAPAAKDEILYRFEFPERPGALMRFLNSMSAGWNISLFHYRNHGADYGSILVGLQVPKSEMREFRRFLERLGYPYADATRNPAYRLFLG
jgi:hypothetical protein